ncbi:hypothetical protein [Novacetimonas hansenii]|uniref:hypothetical protein n=1 Tax=Novacetimonas hansenii TaxID=436 RepID=UPI00094FF833|nr:hypothetical protein [Novacetimonas hansenii]
MSKTFPLSRALCRLGLVATIDEARALIWCGRVHVDGDVAPSRAFVGYGAMVSVRGIGERVVSRQTLGVR